MIGAAYSGFKPGQSYSFNEPALIDWLIMVLLCWSRS
jgi:hypothetical protein